MKCPVCSSDDHAVLDTRHRDGMTRRLRQCATCGKRFATVEALEEVIDQANEIRARFVALQMAIDVRG